MEPWSSEALAAAEYSMQAIRRHPFVLSLADGSLDADRFDTYLQQDDIYLDAYAHLMRKVCNMIPCGEKREELQEWINQSLEEENDMHSSMGQDKPAVSVLPGTAAYLHHISEAINSGNLCRAMASTLPCTLVYNEIGHHIAELSEASGTGNPYRDWIELYRSPLMDRGAELFRTICDELAEASGKAVREMMTDEFVASVRCELGFWDQAWNIKPNL